MPSPSNVDIFAVDAGLGEPMDPTLGNPGYDVRHYELVLGFDPDNRVLDALVTISATATARLASVNVDFVGFDVEEVTIDGDRATFARTRRDMTILPREPLAAGQEFTLTVRYRGTPRPITSTAGVNFPLGWQTTVAGMEYVVSEPDGARSWFPCNDHPSDKASYTFRLTVPEPLVAAANGVLVETILAPGGATWVWEMDDPMATYLATLVIGDNAIVDDPESTALAGVPVRNLIPPNASDSFRFPPNGPTFDELFRETVGRQGEMIAFLSDYLGAYPFDTYGIALVPGVPGALETQTLVLVGSPFLQKILVHEIAHQWLGNHVSVARWKDIWLNEGFATYAEWLWQEHRGEITLAELVAFEYTQLGGLEIPPGDPPPHDLFNRSVYGRGALTLHALRLRVGDEAFFSTLRVWVARYGGGSASTADFISLAEEISGSDLTSLFDGWLYDDAMPELPIAE